MKITISDSICMVCGIRPRRHLLLVSILLSSRRHPCNVVLGTPRLDAASDNLQPALLHLSKHFNLNSNAYILQRFAVSLLPIVLRALCSTAESFSLVDADVLYLYSFINHQIFSDSAPFILLICLFIYLFIYFLLHNTTSNIRKNYKENKNDYSKENFNKL